jgi:predicted enzyme related to lactoylglutathione lyase
MPTRTSAWPAGTPCWIDLAADDPAAAGRFYADLFGWTIEGGGEETGGYAMASLDGHQVAGIGGKPAPDAPSTWSTYLASDDADATAARIKHSGGSLHMDPFDVMDAGRMFFATAPDEATFGVWQARAHHGVGRYNEPGSVAWNELLSRDLDGAREFYGAVFDYTYEDVSTPDFHYFLFQPPGAERPVGGLGPAASLPQGAPSVWVTWFAVADCDASVAKVAELGGSTVMEPSDSPFGRMSVVAGAQSEVFGLIQLETNEPTR